MKIIIVFTLLFILTGCSQTQKFTPEADDHNPQIDNQSSAAYTLPNTKTFSLKSLETDDTYLIAISFPDSYTEAAPTTTYPVIYVLDGQWRFPLVYSIAGAITEDGDIPESLVVSISWKETHGNLFWLREKDLTPSTAQNTPHSGNAIKFQKFLRDQLFPYIEKNYKASDHRTLTGSSYSGLFTAYTLLSQPDLFNGYIAATPSLWWDNESIYRFLKNFPNTPLKKKTRFYLSWGELESQDAMLRFAKSLSDRHVPNLEITYAPVQNSGHSAVNAEAYTKGLQFIFQKPDLYLPNNKLQEFAGTYKNAGENADIQFIIKNGRLHCVFNDGTTFALKAASNNEFYIQGKRMSFTFNLKTSRIHFNNHGSLFELARI